MSELSPHDSASNLTASSSNKRPRAAVWEYFEVCKEDKTKAICSLCPNHKNKFSYENYGTKNLTFSQELFEERLIKWIVKNDQPFTEVESTGFKELLTLLKPNLSIVSANTVKRRIMDTYDVKQSEMNLMFQKLDSKVSFTTDCWTSPNNLAFMGVTAHYINEDWELQVTTLDFIHLPGPHSGSNLHKCFVSVLETYGLETKSLAITLDNASNNDSFIDYLDNDDSTSFKSFHHIRCFAHIVNLSAQVALDVLKNDLIKLRIGIKRIRSSPQSFLKFKELQYGMNLKPILDCPTRWSSTADMLERAIKLKAPIISYLAVVDSVKKASDEPLSLTSDAWGNFERILEYLVPFRQATRMVCGDTYPSLSMVVPLYNKLMDHLKLWMLKKTNPQDTLHRAVVAANAKIAQYYDLTSDCYTISTVLDPRFKLDYYRRGKEGNRESYQEVFLIVNAVYQKFYASENDLQVTKVVDTAEKSESFFLFDEDYALNPNDEFKAYCGDNNRLRPDADILGWWKLNSKNYPNLSKMAKDYLAIPGTSASSERLFSSGKHLISDTRQSLSPSTIRACQCLKSWGN